MSLSWPTIATTRRDQLIEQLLASEDFVDYWTYRWCDMLLINGTRLRPVAVKTYYQWVHDSVRENKPWDQFVREILTATGGSDENGATNFYALHQSPEDMTENACQAFLGLSIGCAKCHNHPLEKWTNDQYYSMANLFARVRAKGWGGDGRNGDGIRTLYVAASGDLIQPNRGKPQPPAPLDSQPLEFDDPRDRREALADWMTDPENPYFARAITNRVWANFFGRGLVEQVDDLRLSNPASSEPLLAAAAQHVVEAKFDLKQLMRTILAERDLSAQQRAAGGESGRAKVPQSLLSATVDGRSAARFDRSGVGYQRPRSMKSLSRSRQAEDGFLRQGHAGDRVVRRGGQFLFPEDVRPQSARDHLRMRTQR